MTVTLIRQRNCGVGIALNPATPVGDVAEIVTAVDLITVMTIEPGFAGQTYMPHSYRRITALKQMITDAHSSALIEIDGGITPDTGRRSIAAGADILVGGYFCTFQKGMSSTDSFADFCARL